MRFTVSTAFLALASSVLAQTPGFDPITKPTKGEVIPAGSTFEIEWEASTNWTGPVTIGLLGGPDAGGLQPISVLAEGIDSSAGQYSWAVNKTLGTQATYGIRITLESDTAVFQYSFPFAISAAAGTSSSSSSGSSAVSSSAAPSSSSSSESKTVTAAETTQTTVMTTGATSAPTAGNLSTTAQPSQTTLVIATSTATAKASSTATSSPTGSHVPTSPAAVVRASSIALIGGLALALFAL